MFNELKYILGDSLYYLSIQDLYDKWKFKHINEDRINQGDFEKTLSQALKLNKQKYKRKSELALKHVDKNYNFENACKTLKIIVFL